MGDTLPRKHTDKRATARSTNEVPISMRAVTQHKQIHCINAWVQTTKRSIGSTTQCDLFSSDP